MKIAFSSNQFALVDGRPQWKNGMKMKIYEPWQRSVMRLTSGSHPLLLTPSETLADSSNPHWFSPSSQREMRSIGKQWVVVLCLVYWIPAGGTVHMQSMITCTVQKWRVTQKDAKCPSPERGEEPQLTWPKFDSKTTHFPSLDLDWMKGWVSST